MTHVSGFTNICTSVTMCVNAKEDKGYPIVQKAVIQSGGKQYIVAKDDVLDIERIQDEKSVTFDPLLVFDGKDVQVGAPTVKGASVTATVVGDQKGDKVKVMKFQAKKRVKKLTGHRQKYTRIQITNISL